MNVLIVLSLASFGFSLMALVWSYIAVSRSADFSKEGLSFLRLVEMREKVDRFSAIEESVVRSVMEEGGQVSVEAVLRTAERLKGIGIIPSEAIRQARDMHEQ